MSRLVALVVLAALVGACGVSTETEPRAIDADDVPFGLTEEASASSTTLPATSAAPVVYLTNGTTIVPVERPDARPVTARRLLRSLLRGPTPADRDAGLRSALPSSVSLRSVTLDGAVATVDLGGPLTELIGTEQALAIAQLVFTVTELRGVRGLRLRLDGDAIAVPVRGGTLTTSPVGRDDVALE
jgi:spore germination protein GerM